MNVDRIYEIVDAIRDRLEIAEKTDPGVLDEMYADSDHLQRDELTGMLAQDAVNAITAPALWRRAIGPTLDTTEVTAKLGISRQALAQRVTHRSLLALPGRRTRHYPTWQFGGSEAIRPIVAAILRRWYQAEPQIEPETIAVWAATPAQVGADEPVRPGELIEAGDDELVLALLDDTIARRTR